MTKTHLRVLGAREHNLKNIDVEIPRRSLTVITGLSGSGKSSLAFDTIYAEGQRRYIESLSAYARQFLDQLPKPDVERIEGLSPAISIEQKTVSRNPRSTVGTVTEIYDYMRLLFSTVGSPHCPKCRAPLVAQDADSIANHVIKLPAGTKLMVMAPVIRGRKGEYQALFQKFLKDGYIRAKIDGEVMELDPAMRLKKQYKHDISVVVDRLYVNPEMEERLRQAIRNALKMADGLAIVETLPDRHGHFPADLPWEGERAFSRVLGCPEHGPQVTDMAPRIFSFNSRYGQCPACEGLGTRSEIDVARIVPDPNLSLKQGAVGPWKYYYDRNGPKKQIVAGSAYARLVVKVLGKLGVDPLTPWNELLSIQRDVLLYGATPTDLKKLKLKKAQLGKWTGLVKHLEKRMQEAIESGADMDSFTEYIKFAQCVVCNGSRLRPESLAVTVGGQNIAELTRLGLEHCLDFFKALEFTGRQSEIAQQPLREIVDRLGFLLNVGLGYLSLDRTAGTLSGGEAQRIRLATQIGSQLRGVLYILDEPSIGLHQRDNEKLIATLLRIRDQGNTVIVVEHDEQTIRQSDYVIDLGPGAGRLGGAVVAAGKPETIVKAKDSLTGQYLSGAIGIDIPAKRRVPGDRSLAIRGATLHNLKNVDLEIPAGLMIGITGVSGSGKSSLIMETMLPLLMNHCYKASHHVVGPHRIAEGVANFDRCINVDQSPIGRTPRSNPATYTKIFDEIRDLFSMTQEARARGYDKGRFSFNVKGGRCENCGGQGMVRIEMNFLPNVYIQCETCGGSRYNDETLAVKYKEKSIADVLAMTVDEAVEFFEPVPKIFAGVKTLQDVGLGYIHIGQSATTLSGGEAQRIKLVRELSKKNTGKSMYILDEPTTGLHFADVHQLLWVLNRLVEAGSTVVVIEHNLDVVKCCDWLIDLGPDAGERGGEIVAQGPPERVAESERSETARFLREMLPATPKPRRSRAKSARTPKR